MRPGSFRHIWHVRPDLRQRLTEHVGNQAMSFAQVAIAINAEFGTAFTRNACIGAARRLGLCKPSSPDQTNATRKPREEHMQPTPKPAPDPPPPILNSVPLVDANWRQCRWIVDETVPTVCGQPGKPWCDEHRKVVFQPHKKRSAA